MSLGERRDVPALLAWADVAVHASTTPEPLGNVVMESLALGVPTVGADAGGILDILLQERTGLRTPPGDAEGLAAAVARLLEDDSLRARFAVAGPEHVRRRFGRDAIARQLLDIYRGTPDIAAVAEAAR